jgi:putative pyruvate formate lyase activating enzyme
MMGEPLVAEAKRECSSSELSYASAIRERATLRFVEAYGALSNCHLCVHHCGVNRLVGQLGVCHAGPHAKVFSAQVEVGDELELIPTFAIAVSGCDLRCDFCITGESSWNPRVGEALSVEVLVSRARLAINRGSRTIMFLGGEPTIHLPSLLELAAAMPSEAKLVWKTNAHGSQQARKLLDGIFDIWLADYKFGNDLCASRLAKVPGYSRTVRENLVWAAGDCELIVRHLLMPGHLDCCWRPVAQWLANELPGVKVSLRASFWPGWHAARHRELRRTVSNEETEIAFQFAAELGLNLIE